MGVTVYFANISKRRNSTLQGTFSTSYDCVLKAPTSLDRPTFLVEAATMDYNAAKMGDRYYFIDDVVSVRNGQWEVSCILDVLATYKADILASTQYVTYSANAAKTWLPDMRIPVQRDMIMPNSGTAIFTQIADTTGFYVLAATGKDGCVLYAMDRADIKRLLLKITDWADDILNDIRNGTYTWSPTDLGVNFESLGDMLIQSGTIGNAYTDAPNNIRSCIWVPFSKAQFTYSATSRLYLGQFDTELDLNEVLPGYITDDTDITIPWTYNDWRRMYESVYIHLPYAGTMELSADSLTQCSQLNVKFSATASDGCVVYEICPYDANGAKRAPIARFSGQCSSNYPIGVSQQSSAGEIGQAILKGIEKTCAQAVQGSQSLTSMPAGAAATLASAVAASWEVSNATMTAHNTTIGGTGGGASAGLNRAVHVFTVGHSFACTPAAMAATMGRPMMEATSLASLTGFCQCANAHVAAPAQARELDAIDAYLNSGFFIE